MSGSTNDPAGNTLAGLAITRLRANALSALRDDTMPGQLAAMSVPANNDLATALLVASVIIENAQLFNPKVIERAYEVLEENSLLQAHSLLALPTVELPHWVYEQAAEEQDRRNAELDRRSLQRMLDRSNDPTHRRKMLDLLTQSEHGLTEAVLTTQPDLRPALAATTASVVLEYSDRFPPPLAELASTVLEQFGQSTEPGSPLTATQQLLDVVPAELSRLNDEVEFAATVAGLAAGLTMGLLDQMMPDVPSRANPLAN